MVFRACDVLDRKSPFRARNQKRQSLGRGRCGVGRPARNVLSGDSRKGCLRDGKFDRHEHDGLFAAGGYLGENSLVNFLGERSNPLNRNRYLYNRCMLVDPLTNDPLVVTGSANFSRPAQRINDENMLLIRGDIRVADIYYGEFMRMFDHHYARYLVRKLTAAGTSDPNAGYL